MDLTKAIHRAHTDTALFMTSDIRGEALKSGWSKDVVKSMRVVHRDGEYAVQFPESVAEKAWVHEYGDPDNTPTAVIRKYDTSSPRAQDFLSERFNHHLGGGI